MLNIQTADYDETVTARLFRPNAQRESTGEGERRPAPRGNEKPQPASAFLPGLSQSNTLASAALSGTIKQQNLGYF
jgi:hypothetical protein